MVAFYPGGGSFPLIRYAEMLYTEAEADMHLGKEAEAKDLLFEAVAQYDDAYTKSEKTGDELMDEIKLYRRFDLWGEGNAGSTISVGISPSYVRQGLRVVASRRSLL